MLVMLQQLNVMLWFFVPFIVLFWREQKCAKIIKEMEQKCKTQNKP